MCIRDSTKCEAVGLAPYRRMVRTRGRPLPRGRWPSPARPRTASRAAISPAFCVRRAADDGLAAHGWPGQRRPIRPLAASLASSSRMTSPRRATGELRACASPTRCRSGAARPMQQQQHWPQSGGVVGRWRAGRRQLVASCALAGVPRGRWCEAPAAAVRGGPSPCIGTRSHLSPSRHGRREARGRQAGAASVALGRARLDVPLGRRRAGAGVDSSRCAAPPSLPAAHGHAYWCTCGGGSSPRPYSAAWRARASLTGTGHSTRLERGACVAQLPTREAVVRRAPHDAPMCPKGGL